MSSKEEIAQQLLDQCEAIEASREKINEAVKSSLPKEKENISAKAYRQQIEQCRRALVTSQENAKLKHEKMENTIKQLKKEIENMRADLKCLKDCDKINNSDTSTLQRDLKAAREWAMKAQKHSNQVNQENAKLKQIIAGMKRGESLRFWKKSPNIFNKQQRTNANNDNENTPTRNVFKNLGSQIAASFRKVDEVQNSAAMKTATLREKLDFSSEGTGNEKKTSRVLQDLGSTLGSKLKQEEGKISAEKTSDQKVPAATQPTKAEEKQSTPQSNKPIEHAVSTGDEKNIEKPEITEASVQKSVSNESVEGNETSDTKSSPSGNIESESATSQNETEISDESLPMSNNQVLLNEQIDNENPTKSELSLEQQVNAADSVNEQDEAAEESTLIPEENLEKDSNNSAEPSLDDVDSDEHMNGETPNTDDVTTKKELNAGTEPIEN